MTEEMMRERWSQKRRRTREYKGQNWPSDVVVWDVNRET